MKGNEEKEREHKENKENDQPEGKKQKTGQVTYYSKAYLKALEKECYKDALEVKKLRLIDALFRENDQKLPLLIRTAIRKELDKLGVDCSNVKDAETGKPIDLSEKELEEKEECLDYDKIKANAEFLSINEDLFSADNNSEIKKIITINTALTNLLNFVEPDSITNNLNELKKHGVTLDKITVKGKPFLLHVFSPYMLSIGTRSPYSEITTGLHFEYPFIPTIEAVLANSNVNINQIYTDSYTDSSYTILSLITRCMLALAIEFENVYSYNTRSSKRSEFDNPAIDRLYSLTKIFLKYGANPNIGEEPPLYYHLFITGKNSNTNNLLYPVNFNMTIIQLLLQNGAKVDENITDRLNACKQKQQTTIHLLGNERASLLPTSSQENKNDVTIVTVEKGIIDKIEGLLIRLLEKACVSTDCKVEEETKSEIYYSDRYLKALQKQEEKYTGSINKEKLKKLELIGLLCSGRNSMSSEDILASTQIELSEILESLKNFGVGLNTTFVNAEYPMDVYSFGKAVVDFNTLKIMQLVHSNDSSCIKLKLEELNTNINNITINEKPILYYYLLTYIKGTTVYGENASRTYKLSRPFFIHIFKAFINNPYLEVSWNFETNYGSCETALTYIIKSLQGNIPTMSALQRLTLIMKALLERGIDPNIEVCNRENKYTALNLLLFGDRARAKRLADLTCEEFKKQLDLLLEYGAVVNEETMRTLSQYLENPEFVKFISVDASRQKDVTVEEMITYICETVNRYAKEQQTKALGESGCGLLPELNEIIVGYGELTVDQLRNFNKKGSPQQSSSSSSSLLQPLQLAISNSFNLLNEEKGLDSDNEEEKVYPSAHSSSSSSSSSYAGTIVTSSSSSIAPPSNDNIREGATSSSSASNDKKAAEK